MPHPLHTRINTFPTLRLTIVRNLVTVGLALVFFTGWASPAFAQTLNDSESSGVGIRLVDVPEATKDDPRTFTSIIDRLAPGATIDRRVEVANNSSFERTVRIYSEAATVHGGRFDAASGSSTNELTAWTSFDHESLLLGPQETAMVTVTVDIPVDASESEYYSVVWAEVRSADIGGTSVVQATRAGIRMLLSVGPGNGSPVDFDIGALTPARDTDGAPTVSAVVRNAGGRAVDIAGDLTLTNGPAGLSAGPFTLQQATTLASGDSGEVVFTLSDELPNGPWDATLSLESGLLEREASATITFPDAGVGETVAPNRSPVLLITLVSSGAVLLLLSAGTLWWLRRRRAAASAAMAIEAASAATSV